MLVHPGGPYWTKRDEGAWSIAKGEGGEGDDPIDVVRREFAEETGFAGHGPFLDLGELRQSGGKRVRAWAFEGDFDIARLVSNRFTMEWPPRSGRMQSFPEVDRGEWLPLDRARDKILTSQRPFLDRLETLLAAGT